MTEKLAEKLKKAGYSQDKAGRIINGVLHPYIGSLIDTLKEQRKCGIEYITYSKDNEKGVIRALSNLWLELNKK